ncbi:shikimate kinase [Bradyrhizobium sp. CCGUVB4N]|uniref:shikimate kinase n=1 Tax=Bradyrhizobium sp. CCGUVB4N TaxID=2949631 RepID=UPI0020B2222B|nr:shikimate kinase [Bradyrhizobium sp. CCGUVB4N]MCP3380124.1 shikimate kinase [Bradyrhizobium sp. CCGUVB4N]
MVSHDKQLQRAGGEIYATFVRKAAAHFRSQFVPRFEDDIRRGKSWGYATVCNVVSREVGGQEGVGACKAMAARVSQCHGALLYEVEPKTLSLLAASFGRHPQSRTCRNGTIRIAEFCRDEDGALGPLNSQGLSLLVNGFSKWAQREETREGTEAVAREVRRRADRRFRLSDFDQQNLANLVNGFSKWPHAADCRDAMATLASEVLRRASSDFGLSAFNHQDLANLVNGFGKCPEEEAFCQAAVRIADEVLRRDRRARLSEFTHQELPNLVYGFSKWPEQRASRQAAGAIAGEVLRRDHRARLSEFSQQELANLVNGFTKWPQEASSRQATGAIAGEVARRAARGCGLSDFNHQDVANLVNGFSKWPEEAVCRQATANIATELSRRAPEQGLSHFSPQELANLVNGFSKCPDDANCHQAAVAIASEVIGRRAQLSEFTYQNLTNLVNGFSKWADGADCRHAALAIANEICRRDDQLSHLTQQALASLVNGFSKWPEEVASLRASVAIASEVARRAVRGELGLSDFDRQGLANLVNGFSKWPQETPCRQATANIATELSRRAHEEGLFHFTSQELANLVNGFSKCPDDADCHQATIAIAGEVIDRRGQLSDFNYQNLTNLVNGFSKWPDGTDCRDAALAIASEIFRRDDQLSHLTPQTLATLVNGFSKWPEEAPSRQAAGAMASEVLRRDRRARLSEFRQQDLANLVNGFTKWPENEWSRQTTGAIAGEVRRRAARGEFGLSDFNHQDLVNLVNGFCKWPEGARNQRAADAIAHEVLRRGAQLRDFTHQHLTNLVNGFSKWPNAAGCREATVAIAGEIRGRQLSDFAAHELANLVNGFSKWPEAPASQQAAVAIAHEILRRGAPLSDFDHQHLSNLVNGFSKWRETPDCRDATVAIAAEVPGRQLSDFTPQGLANLVNGFSKWPEMAASGQATVAIADEVCRRGAWLSDFSHQHLANLVNGFSKWPEAAECRGGTVAIAREVLARDIWFSDFTSQELANLVNGFSKWPDEAAFQQATVAIANEVLRHDVRLRDSTHQELANLVNGFSKWPEEPAPRDATFAIASEVLRRAELSDFAPQWLANLVNGFSKWPEASASRDATFAIASEVLRRAELSDFAPQGLASLVNGFSKWPDEEDCRKAAAAIAEEARRRQHADFAPQVVATLVNGFAKWPEEAACRQSTMDIARGLGVREWRFGVFTTPQLSMLANALSRTIMSTEDSGEITEAALPKDRLHKLAHYLYYDHDRLEQADVLHITTIFKGLGKARLVDDLGLLAPTGLNRLSELRQAPDFSAKNDLETMGNLCAALLPLARSPQRPLRWHRRQALNLLNDVQPVVEHKIEAHLNANDAERIRGPLASRCPALSIYQTLKARAVLERLFRSPYVEGKRPELRIRQEELHDGTREILAGARDLIQGDLSSMSWNLIAQIEADSPVDALDLFMEQDAAAIQAQHPASVFDVHQVLRSMDHAPRTPQGDAGLMQLPVVDMQGRPLAKEPEMRYSIFHRLTSGVLPVVAVQLPATPSAFMLARTVNVNGVPYRMDLFGGSKLKPPRLTVSQVAARAPGEPAKPTGGKLLAIPYAETAPGTAFEQLSRAWAPFKEAYYYTQRRGFAAPPAIKDLSPHDYALEGAFKLALLPDRPTNEEHPFKLRGLDGPIALRPHDGCGFIRASLANLMPAVRRTGQQEGPDRVLAYGEARHSVLPVSALQHYPRSEQVADEVREKARSWLESRKDHKLTSEELFRTVTAGHINGLGAIAIPSADGRLHVPTLKSGMLSGGGVLIGRSPYDKPNLRPLAPDQVRSPADVDPTATFLDQCVTIQYSFNVAQKSGKELAANDPTFFAKGLLIVVPDEMWPTDFADRALVMSAEDVKCHSNWTKSKDRAKVDTAIDCVGILQATELFASGSVVAVPPDEQKKLDGDFDGDSLLIIGDRPQLYEHVGQFDQEEQARGLRSLKPPKSHTPAIEDGHYKFGRASQILAATRNVLEIYTGLQRGFLAQSNEARQWFAERAIFGTYEGVHQELKRGIGDLLEQEQVSVQDVQDKLKKARHEIELADHPVAREMAELLVTELEAWTERLDEQALPGQLVPETAASVSETQLALSQPLCELFPELAEVYPATAQPRDRIQLIVDRYPVRIDPRPDGYNPHDLVQSASNLLSLGIKVGTDAYKSDTGAHTFMIKSGYLQRLLQQTPGLKSVPYAKSVAAALNQGQFDVDATLDDLKDNPTLAASVMQVSIKLAAEQGILPEPSRRELAADDSATTITLTREQAAQRAQMEASRAQAEENSITAMVGSVAEALRRANIEVKMPHLAERLRSESSMTDQLAGMQAPSEASVQLISNAVRHVLELPDRDFTRAVKKAILAFDESGCAEVSTTNWFKARSPTFVGIKTVFATTSGYRFEVEFHTADSYTAKIINHDTYKELQKLQEGQRTSREPSDQSMAEPLLERVRQACSKVVVPEGATSIPHWEADAGGTAGTSLVRRLQKSPPGRTAHSAIAREVVGALGARPVVLVGMPGAGKSAIGSHLARRLGLPFIDSDKKIETMARLSIADIFATKGERHFRDLEARLIAEFLERGPAVFAIGDGAFMREETRRCVAEKGVSIWLNTDAGEIKRRLRRDTARPLLQTEDRADKITQLIRERAPFYQLADLTIVPGQKRDNKNADQCVAALHAHLCGERGADRTPANVMGAPS